MPTKHVAKTFVVIVVKICLSAWELLEFFWVSNVGLQISLQVYNLYRAVMVVLGWRFLGLLAKSQKGKTFDIQGSWI